MTESSAPTRNVGVDIQDTGDETRPLIEAITADNEGATVSRMPGLIRIQTPTAMTIRRETVESKLGRPWETGEFQMSIVSYFGHISDWDDDEIVIRWDH